MHAIARRTDLEIDELLARGARAPAEIVAESDVDRLPAPVVRWLRWSGVVGTPSPATVRLKQEGEFRTGENRGWVPFSAEQYFTLTPPGFLWRVDLRFSPLVAVVGRDRWVDGDASMKMRLFGAVPVVHSSGRDLAQGAMLPWAGEIIWFPQAALCDHIAWEPIDDVSARATITVGGQAATETFSFDWDGRPIRVTAQRFNDSKQACLPWVAVNREYGEFHGVRVPVGGFAFWKYDAGDFEYIRWHITQLDFDRPERF